MDLGIDGKRALVVGASRGMGKAAADELERAGCRVLRAARSGGDIRLDITDPEQVRTMVDGMATAPDIIVHVAGGSGGIRDATVSSAEYAKVWQLNIGAAIDINRAFLPDMVRRRWGRIVHFSSNGVKLKTGNVPYISAKHALEGYVQRMGRLYADKGVVISAVSPGPIYTPGIFMYDQDAEWTQAFWEKYVPMKRWGQPEEVAGAVALLCSERASYMAGAIVDVDGGMR